MKEVKIGNRTLEVPIIQGGMGVGISLGNLAGHVALEGGMGVISAAHPGFKYEGFETKSVMTNLAALESEIKKARKISMNKGLVAVNIMVAMEGYQNYVRKAVEANADAIISGAGLPLDLPELVNEDTLIAPIVSSQKALELIIRRWNRKHKRLPDFVVIEGSKAGGHLGFKKEDLISGNIQSLEEILKEVLDYQKSENLDIPVFVAGGVYDHEDIMHYIGLGASGVQMGTRFVTTYECDAPMNFKQAYLDCGEDDIFLVKSPTGFTGRAIRNKFMDTIMKSDNMSVDKCYGCLKKCNPKDTPYCISEALINAASGKKDSLIFCGSNAYKTKSLVTVHELMKELKGE